jgi:hypothetical protein
MVRRFSFSATTDWGTSAAAQIPTSPNIPKTAGSHPQREPGTVAAGTVGVVAGWGALSTVLFVVSVTDLTTQAGWMVALAMAALVAAGWRKTARATTRTPRREPVVRRKWVPIGVAETTVPLYRRPNVLRRIWAVVASSGLAIVTGAVLAIVIAFALSYAVITLTDLLKQ